MSVLYHLTVPPSPMSACDAVLQEVQALQKHFGGEVFYLYPGRTPGTRFPRRWWGLQRLISLRKMDVETCFHHIYNPDPYPFSVLRFLRRPVVYTVVAGVRAADRAAAERLAQRVHTLTVPTHADLARLQSWGVKNAVVVRPGIDLSRFSYQPLPPDTPPTLLMGSAPWTREQFHTKGVDALLALAGQEPELRLVFLWRGVLADEMAQRVRSAGLQERVEVLNEQVDVNAVLARVHAAVILADGDALIKAYPHSLLEALAVGRPVLVSRSVPMAARVEQNRWGVVVERVTVADIKLAVRKLMGGYQRYQEGALNISVRDIGLGPMLTAYSRIYDAIASGALDQ